MKGAHPNPYNRDKLGEQNLQLFQEIVDLMAQTFDIPAGLIMRVDGAEIEVLAASNTSGNPYNPGDNEKYIDSGLYCEWVITNERHLLVPNALNSQDWRNNPDIKLDMISYLGMPIMLPDGKVFGTICVLDNKENAYSDQFIRLLEKFKLLVESTLSMVQAQAEIEKRDEFVTEISKIFPICCYCNKIRLKDARWVKVESYIADKTGQHPSHSICPDCEKRFMGE